MTVWRSVREIAKRTPIIKNLAARVRTLCLRYGIETRRRDLLGQMSATYGNRVQAGPFAGMELLNESSEHTWTDGNRLPRLLGTYEDQLHCIIDALTRYGPSLVLNIGCAEGYYAVGLARAIPHVRVYAFDISAAAQRLCQRAADCNDVSDRVKVLGECRTDALNSLLAVDERCLMVLDCEGAESELLDPNLVPMLRNADILVECHDFIRKGITAELIKRFIGTHDVWRLDQTYRAPRESSFLSTLTEIDQLLATCEFRAGAMTWLFCLAKHGEARAYIADYLREHVGNPVQVQAGETIKSGQYSSTAV